MSPTTEERLSAAMHDAARDLRPPPDLAAKAISQSRRTRRRCAAGIGATAIAVAAVAVTTGLPFRGGPEVADGPLAEAPDWSGCAARLPVVNEDLGESSLETWEDAVEVAVCGPVVGDDGDATMDVHVAGPDDARRIAKRVLEAREGTLIEGCLYEVKCDGTWFAVRAADGTVVRLVVTDLGRGALVADAARSRVGAKRVLDAVQEVQASAPWYTYHADDTPPPPFVFGDFACPTDISRGDWETYVASPGDGEQEVLTGTVDRAVICAYRPWDTIDEPIRVLAGIGYADEEAADLVAVIESAPSGAVPDGGGCPDDAGLAYVVLAGSGETVSHALYAPTFGCRIAGEVTPDTDEGERLATKLVTDEVQAALLAAIGPENVA